MENLGKYQIEESLGCGATAEVFRAKDPFLQTDVALKVFRQELLQDREYASQVQRMFDNEARLVRELRHPGIVGILDAVQNPSKTYVVMEYVHGHPLTRHTQSDQLLPVNTVLQIAFKCCMAMHYASEHGLVHRDIKPDNLLLTKHGDIKISDFGTARLSNHTATALSTMMGTPSYMSPEQIWEKPLDARSDIFSLGVVLYELLTGTRPFHSDNLMALLFQIQHEAHPPLRARRTDLPPALSDFLDCALQKTPSDRFASWKAMADQLSGIDQTLVGDQTEFSDREKFLALRQNPFFAEFEDPDIWQTAHLARWHQLDPGAVLMQEGRPGNSFSVLLEGEAAVRKQGKLLFLLKPGDCLGEMAFLKPESARRTATVYATTPVTVVKFRRENIERAGIDLRSRFERRFLRILVDRLQHTTSSLAIA